MLTNFLEKMCAVKTECKFYDNYAIFTIYGLTDKTAEILHSPLKKYFTETKSPAIISWYSHKYTFVLPTDVAKELKLTRFGAPLGFFTYDKVCLDEAMFKNASLKLYNILNSLSIKSVIYSLYFSTSNPIVILDISKRDSEKIRKEIRDLYKDIEIRESNGFMYFYIHLDGSIQRVHIETPHIISDKEIENKLNFIMSYRIEHNLMENSHIQVAYDEIVKFCKNNGDSLNKGDIRSRVLKVLDDLYETCQKEADTNESLNMLKLQAELDGIETFLDGGRN